MQYELWNPADAVFIPEHCHLVAGRLVYVGFSVLCSDCNELSADCECLEPEEIESIDSQEESDEKEETDP